MGSAMVMTQYIRLTPDMQSKQGALWNRVVRLFLPPVLVTQKAQESSPGTYCDLILPSLPSVQSYVDIKGFYFRGYDDLPNEIRYLKKGSLLP